MRTSKQTWMWILIIKVTFQDTKLNLFLGKNRKLEFQNEKTRKATICKQHQGREQDDEICIYYWQRKVVWDAVATLASLSGYMAHVALD